MVLLAQAKRDTATIPKTEQKNTPIRSSKNRKKTKSETTKFYNILSSRFRSVAPIGFMKSYKIFGAEVKPEDCDIGKIFEGKDGSTWEYLGKIPTLQSGLPNKHFRLISR